MSWRARALPAAGQAGAQDCTPVTCSLSLRPTRTPAMIGCSFVVDREYFGDIGLLDPGMEVYGGENIELGMRVSGPAGLPDPPQEPARGCRVGVAGPRAAGHGSVGRKARARSRHEKPRWRGTRDLAVCQARRQRTVFRGCFVGKATCCCLARH